MPQDLQGRACRLAGAWLALPCAAGPLARLRIQVRAGSVSMDISKPSKAMPFLTAPAAMSSGLVGAEAGFDPLYFSAFLDIKWLREAELKHGRICML